MPGREPGEARSWRLALTLSAVAGSVDLICYFSLFHIFTAHMSGNTVSAVAALETGKLGEAVLHALPIPCFVAGVVLGVVIETWEEQAGRTPRLAVTLMMEAAALATFALLAGTLPQKPGAITPVLAVTLALPVIAMGIQNAALGRAGGQNVRTTFITGMLADLAKATTKAVLGREPWQPVAVSASIWVLYLGGAAAGGGLELRLGANAIVLPIAALVLTTFVDGKYATTGR
jgi:uncharacterized membrane protein YoaK (UPF0700 family)